MASASLKAYLMGALTGAEAREVFDGAPKTTTRTVRNPNAVPLRPITPRPKNKPVTMPVAGPSLVRQQANLERVNAELRHQLADERVNAIGREQHHRLVAWEAQEKAQERQMRALARRMKERP